MEAFPFFEGFERFLVIAELMVGPTKVGPDPYAKTFGTIYVIGVGLGYGLKIGQSSFGITY